MWGAGSGDDDGAGERLSRVVGLPPDPLDDLPDEPRRASPLRAFDPGRRGVRVLGFVAALVALLAAYLAWQARPEVTEVPPVTAPSSVIMGSSGPAQLVVSVNGKVKQPGLVTLPPGARVADAIAAAGGALPGTDLAGLNLARKVVDGEMISVEVAPPPGSGATAGGLVNLNTATVAELQTLPGIGEVLAQRIIEHRDKHGGFRAVTDLRQVEGIGDAKFQQLKDRVTV